MATPEVSLQAVGCEIRLRFPIIKLLDCGWETLEVSENPFAVVVMAHRKTQETTQNAGERLRWKLRLVSGQEYRLDLLFYHFKLRCFVVIDLKMVDLQPEFSGKMNFYVSAVNALLRHPDDQPTIGIILCKSKDKTVAELALQSMTQPIGVSTHPIGKDIPAQLQSILPTVEQLELELEIAAAKLEEQMQGKTDKNEES